MAGFRKDKVGNLDCIIYGEEKPENNKIVVLHGYGASAEDLAPFAQMLKLNSNWDWYFLDAPLNIVLGPGVTGKAWFPINTEELEKAMVSGQHRSFKQTRPEGIDAAKKKVLESIKVIKEDSKLVLCGFSQGAMLSTEIALNTDTPIDGLMMLSGAFLSESLWRNKISSIPKFPILQSHGKNDVLLSFGEAKELSDCFRENKWNIDFEGFSGGHEIPPQVIGKMSSFLNSVS